MIFYLNCFIPSLQTTVRFKELTFAQFRDLNKALATKDDNLFEDCINRIISLNYIDSPWCYQLTNYDKFYIMFFLRCLSVSSEIEFVAEGKNIKTNLLPFLTKCSNIKIDEFTPCTQTSTNGNQLEIKLSLPTEFVFKDSLDAATHLIQEIKMGGIWGNGDWVRIHGCSENYRDELLDQIPAIFLSELDTAYKTIKTYFEDLKLELPVLNQTIELNPFDSSLLEFIKILYKTGFTGLYDIQYLMVNKLGYSAEYTDSLTYKEINILTNLFKLEQQRIEQERQKSQPVTTSIPQRPR